ncbi:hypothetical protein [Actinoplanes aureus]|nr:hypothetical protein [Actinoplanes aureus]
MSRLPVVAADASPETVIAVFALAGLGCGTTNMIPDATRSG